MAITYPLSLPNTKFTQFRISEWALVASSPNEFTGQDALYKHAGEGWLIEAALAMQARADADPWRAFFSSLKDKWGTFLIGDPAGETARGALGGTPLVSGAHAAGVSVISVKGGSFPITNWLRAGDTSN